MWRNLAIPLAYAVAIAVLSVSAAESGTVEPSQALFSQSSEELAAGIEHKHPVASMLLAKRLFESGQKDQAVFWFYLGQLRYRAYLMANPGLDPTGEPALFSSLMEVLGRPVNEYAFGDIPALVAVIDRVIAWDDSHPDDYTPPSQTREEVKAGLKKMRADFLARQDEIRATRAANGLPNRNP